MPALEEYIKRYEAKTKDTFRPMEGFKLFFLPERGFCEIRVCEKAKGDDVRMVQIYQLCGDGRFWRDFANLLAQSLGISHAGSICIRQNIKAYMRFWGFKITKKEPLNDGSFIYYGKNSEGKLCRLSPICIHEDKKRISYLVTWEV